MSVNGLEPDQSPDGLPSSMMSEEGKPLLEMQGITKTFPGVIALDNVNLAVRSGEIHALVGENGAGKSTLMKVLSGVYGHREYDGDILFDGQLINLKNIRDAEDLGIVVIHQELALVPSLSIAENLFLGNEVEKRGVIDWPATYARATGLIKRVGLDAQVATPIGSIGVGKQQLVEIAKALGKKVRLLILDEPTASLQENDSATLLDLLLGLKAEGVTSILISHKLGEIARVADRVTVLRDGATVADMDVRDTPLNESAVVQAMVGRDMTERYPARESNIGDVLFEVKNWTVGHEQIQGRNVVDNASMDVRRGEVVGIAGLMGAGRTELAMSLFGRSHGKSFQGQTFMHGEPVDLSTIERAIKAGIAYVTEDRKSLGLVLNESITMNVSLADLSLVSKNGVIDANVESTIAERFREALHIRTPSVSQHVVNLSGGNQQKVVLAKWLHTSPELLILDEPTRGIDVGAKYEIYGLINELATSGKAVLVISSEMPELLGICDRVYVMNEGRLLGQLNSADASQEKIMSMIVNDRPQAATNIEGQVVS